MTIRVLVVEDSLTVRKRLIEVIEADPSFAVVGEAEDGKRAIELCRDLRPDVITLDIIMPLMSGLAVTEWVMAHFPTPILIVSASLNRGEVFSTYDALAAGAVDVLDKPTDDETSEDWERRLLSSLRIVARIPVVTRHRGPRPAVVPELVLPGALQPEVIGIGASTGGPSAVVEVLRALPAPSLVPILLVVHIGEPFGAEFADWLDRQTSHRVRTATDDMRFDDLRGAVVMPPPNRHLVARGRRLYLTRDAERFSCRPSVDVLFESIARNFGAASVAALLTGMGRDGASGLFAVRAAGGRTIAQDEATSVVYGMPREAALIGAAERILPLGEIGPAIAACTRAPGPGGVKS